MLVRRAARFDAPRICALLNRYPAEAALLPRSQAEVCGAIDTFFIAEAEDGSLLGCCALHRYDAKLAEVRSIVVRPDRKGRGVGGALLNALLDEARARSIASICLFTRNPGFFRRHGFTETAIAAFPQKQAKDCFLCPRRHCCDEVAMLWDATPGRAVAGAHFVQIANTHAMYV